MARTSDANRVDDIVQEVILRVWKQAPEAENLRAYLITTARHLIVDQYRAAGRRPQQAQLVDVAEQDSALYRGLDQVSSRRASAGCRPTTVRSCVTSTMSG